MAQPQQQRPLNYSLELFEQRVIFEICVWQKMVHLIYFGVVLLLWIGYLSLFHQTWQKLQVKEQHDSNKCSTAAAAFVTTYLTYLQCIVEQCEKRRKKVSNYFTHNNQTAVSHTTKKAKPIKVNSILLAILHTYQN